MSEPLQVDPGRTHLHGTTGIYIRAKLDGRWGSYDIAELTAESLLDWLNPGGQSNPLAENVVGILLGHGHLHRVDT